MYLNVNSATYKLHWRDPRGVERVECGGRRSVVGSFCRCSHM